jgi:hypothetical protein
MKSLAGGTSVLRGVMYVPSRNTNADRFEESGPTFSVIINIY